MDESKHPVSVDWASGNWLAVEYWDEASECVTLAGDFEELWEREDGVVRKGERFASFATAVERSLIKVGMIEPPSLIDRLKRMVL